MLEKEQKNSAQNYQRKITSTKSKTEKCARTPNYYTTQVPQYLLSGERYKTFRECFSYLHYLFNRLQAVDSHHAYYLSLSVFLLRRRNFTWRKVCISLETFLSFLQLSDRAYVSRARCIQIYPSFWSFWHHMIQINVAFTRKLLTVQRVVYAIVRLSSSLLRSRYQGRHTTLLLGAEALRDDPYNGCEGDYNSLVQARP